MINKVYDILKTLNIPIQHLLRPAINPESKVGISYHFFNEGYEVYGDGKGKEEGGSLQIDIFSTIDYSTIVKQVKELLEKHGFRYYDGRDTDDSIDNTQLFQKILIFNYTESEVEQCQK